MTTNQTIDGVPRSLLQSLYTDTVQQWGVGGNAAGQLRALLDKEVSGDSRAPLPQGEPVAVMYADGSVLTKTECGIAFETCCKVETPLYAEQPAPVAVVLPERSNAVVSANVSAKQAYALGWNACLDEATRLNTK